MAAGATYEPIATQTLGSAAASITFSSIAASWTDLRIVWVGTSAGARPSIQFNNDTGNNYSFTYVYGDGSAATSGRTSNTARIFTVTNQSNTIPSMLTLDIFSYAGSTYKTSLMTVAMDFNGTGYIEETVALWRSTSAITTIKLFDLFGGNLNSGTTATLYGIKNA
jgi:hypothetical protein